MQNNTFYIATNLNPGNELNPGYVLDTSLDNNVVISTFDPNKNSQRWRLVPGSVKGKLYFYLVNEDNRILHRNGDQNGDSIVVHDYDNESLDDKNDDSWIINPLDGSNGNCSDIYINSINSSNGNVPSIVLGVANGNADSGSAVCICKYKRSDAFVWKFYASDKIK